MKYEIEIDMENYYKPKIIIINSKTKNILKIIYPKSNKVWKTAKLIIEQLERKD